MARIRTIKPNHVQDKELANISLQAHLLWILMWPYSDDEGIIEDDPLLIKSNLFPRRTDVRVEQIQQWLGQLVKARFIVPFTHNGVGYYIHRTFKTHQKIDRPQPSKISKEVIEKVLAEYSTNCPRTIDEGSSLYSIVKDSIVKEGEEGAKTPLPVPDKYSDIEKESFRKFEDWIKTNAPNVGKMKEPFTIDQYLNLAKKGYDVVKIQTLLREMHNWKPLLQKRVSANLTLLNWANKNDL